MCTTSGHAAGTRTWQITSYKDFDEGEATGVLLSSLGEAASGFSANRVDIGESVVYSTATAPDGTVYIGTGDQGTLYAYQKGKLRKVAKVDAVLIASIAIGPGGIVFVGTMPGGRIYWIDRAGKPHELAKLEAEHVWAMVYDEGKQTLYAATGPNGRLFAIDAGHLDKPSAGRRDRLVYDTGEKHLLSLVRTDDGALLAGSSDQAILYRIVPNASGAATVQALHDFDGDEVRAIARRGNVTYVAVNEFQRAGASGTTTAGPDQPRGTKIVLPAGGSNTTATNAATLTRDRRGRGAIYRVDPDGRVDQLHALADGYFTSVFADGDGNVWAAAGSNGRVYLVRPDRTVITAFDLPERQVLTLALDAFAQQSHAAPNGLLGTGDAGALYRVAPEPPKDAHYVTKVYDAQFPARWGNLRWTGHGALTMETRSGNTSHPDKTWSAWAAPQKSEKTSAGAVARISSPDGRYLQLRANFGGAHTVLRDLTVYYQPQNQRPRITELTVGEDAAARKPSAVTRSSKPRSPVVKLRWRVENPDEDDLVYRIYFREENEANWKPLGGPEPPLTRTEFDWNTESIPDGNYVVKVVASDERSNPREQALEHALTSTPFLVDNRKPELSEVNVAYPQASGRAHDSFSTISELAYSIDGGDWQPFAPKDGIFDDPTEDFSIKLPSGLAAGTHSLAVRAVDAADNVGAIQVSFKVAK